MFVRVHTEMVTTVRLFHISMCSHSHLGGVSVAVSLGTSWGWEVGTSPRKKHRRARPWAWLLLSRSAGSGLLPNV